MSTETPSAIVNDVATRLIALTPKGSVEYGMLEEALRLIEPAADPLIDQEAPSVEHAAEAAAEAYLTPAAVHAVEHEVDPNNPGGVTYPWLHPAEAPTPAPQPAPVSVAQERPALPLPGQPVNNKDAANAAQTSGAGSWDERAATLYTSQLDGAGIPSAHPDDPAPVWGQNINDNPGGAIDQAHASDCGEQCCAMALYATRGVEVPEEVIRAYIQGSPASAYGTTNAGQLAAYLHGRHCNLNAESDPRPYPHARDTIESEVAQDHLVIALGQWITSGYGHWMVFRGYDETSVRYNDPWFANERHMSWSDFEQNYWGQLVLIHEPARYS